MCSKWSVGLREQERAAPTPSTHPKAQVPTTSMVMLPSSRHTSTASPLSAAACRCVHSRSAESAISGPFLSTTSCSGGREGARQEAGVSLRPIERRGHSCCPSIGPTAPLQARPRLLEEALPGVACRLPQLRGRAWRGWRRWVAAVLVGGGGGVKRRSSLSWGPTSSTLAAAASSSSSSALTGPFEKTRKSDCGPGAGRGSVGRRRGGAAALQGGAAGRGGTACSPGQGTSHPPHLKSLRIPRVKREELVPRRPHHELPAAARRGDESGLRSGGHSKDLSCNSVCVGTAAARAAHLASCGSSTITTGTPPSQKTQGPGPYWTPHRAAAVSDPSWNTSIRLPISHRGRGPAQGRRWTRLLSSAGPHVIGNSGTGGRRSAGGGPTQQGAAKQTQAEPGM